QAFVDRTGDRVIYFDDRSRRLHHWVPSGDGPIFGGKKEDGGLGRRQRKISSRVEHLASRRGRRSSASSRGHNDHQWASDRKRSTVAIVDGNDASPIVRDPERTTHRVERDAPGIYKV